MVTVRDKGSRRAHLAIAVGAAVACLLVPTSAMAGPDTLNGGSVSIQLRGAGGVKLRPATLGLPITRGELDPISGSGTIETTGGFRAKRGARKANVSVTGLTLGAGGAPGRLAAQVGKRRVGSFGTLTGGTVTRAGFGAALSGITLRLAPKGAKALSRALGAKGGKGRASAGIKAGRTIGTISATTVPATVEVLRDSGSMELATSLAAGSLGAKLASHCIDAVTPILVTPGVAAVPPATFNPLTTTFTFPVTGGFVAPDFSDGRLITGGGQTLTKNNGPLTPNLGGPPCSTQGPPVGSTILSSDFEAQFSLNALASNTTVPTGFLGLTALGPIDFSTGTRSIDQSTGDLVVEDATVVLDSFTAFVLNQVFPNQSGDPANDFAGGDLVGTLGITAKLR
jgi:hypothetical protein